MPSHKEDSFFIMSAMDHCKFECQPIRKSYFEIGIMTKKGTFKEDTSLVGNEVQSKRRLLEKNKRICPIIGNQTAMSD